MIKKNALRILIADDHPVVREGLAAIAEQQEDMQVVGAACNGREAVELFCALQPDVTLMDLRMPQMDGVGAITAIRARSGCARILVLSTYDGDEDIYRGLHAGAKGYLLKDTGRERLLEAIRAVHAGQTFIPSELASKLVARMNGPVLSAREQQVLEQMAQGHSNAEIGRALFITEATVKTHVNNILNKLEVHDRTQAVTTALRRGIVQLQE